MQAAVEETLQARVEAAFAIRPRRKRGGVLAHGHSRNPCVAKGDTISVMWGNATG
jgi:hypothetical protein